MIELPALSVGFIYDYPLLGGEKFYDLIPTFNEKFGLTLTEENFKNISATRQEDDLIKIEVIADDDSAVYQFINLNNDGVTKPISVDFQNKRADVVRCKPVCFKEEIEFLSTFPLNLTVKYNLLNSSKLFALAEVLTLYSTSAFNSAGNNATDGFILRYYGSGENVPEEYGTYPDSSLVCIVDIPSSSGYTSYCLRTEVDYVAHYGD